MSQKIRRGCNNDPTQILTKSSPFALQTDWWGMVVHCTIRFNLTRFLANSKVDVKIGWNLVTLKYIVKQGNFEHIVLYISGALWETDHRASSGMCSNYKNQCRPGGTFPYFSTVQTFWNSTKDLSRADSGRVVNSKSTKNVLIIVLSEQVKHHYLCFGAWGVHWWC